MQELPPSRPVFSIIVATYNSESTLKLCLQSIFQQEPALFELLIVDGGSTDTTLDIIAPYKPRLAQFISENDDGVYDAWNKQLNNIKGKWTLFLGSDDCFKDKNSLQHLDGYLNNNEFSDVDFVFSEVDVVDSIHNKVIVDQQGQKSIGFYRKIFKQEMLFSHTGCLHRSSLFHAGLKFDKSYKIAGDYEFILRAISGNVNKIAKYDSVLLQMGQGGLSTSCQSRLTAYTESQRARFKNKLYLPSIRLMYRTATSVIMLIIEKTLGANALLFASNCYRRLLGKNLRKTIK